MKWFTFMSDVYGWALVIGLIVGLIWVIAGLIHFHVHPLY